MGHTCTDFPRSSRPHHIISRYCPQSISTLQPRSFQIRGEDPPIGAARVDRHRARLVHHQLVRRFAHYFDISTANGRLVAMCPVVLGVRGVVDRQKAFSQASMPSRGCCCETEIKRERTPTAVFVYQALNYTAHLTSCQGRVEKKRTPKTSWLACCI